VKTPIPPLFPALALSLALACGLSLKAQPAAGDPGSASSGDVKLIQGDGRIRVEIGGQLFTEYVYEGASRSYCYPILAPDGTPLTRDFPMKNTPGEEQDHPWHRSFFFAHSMVGGVDFWNEGTGDNEAAPANKGHTVVDGAVETTSGRVGVIHVRDRWLDHDGVLVCTDERTLRFHASDAGRFIDFEITLNAPADRPLLFGDNKDGTMAVRVAEWMTMARKTRRGPVGGTGHIVTAKGDRDAQAWGKRADWADYHAEHAGRTYGVAIFDSPQNLRHPTWWMARDYGLFGANPFGQHDYENLRDQPHLGDYAVPAGGSLTLRYRFFFHLGDEVASGIAEQYAEYAKAR
jgi:hypothetical protein